MALHWDVLAVDDDEEKLDELERIFSNNVGESTFSFTKVTSFAEGLERIAKQKFDLVFLDVHEESGDPDPGAEPSSEDQKGEELLRKLQSTRFCPVVFYTGYPEKVKHLASLVVKVVEKGTNIGEIRGAVEAIEATKLPHLLSYIEEKSREYMWDALQSLTRGATDAIKPSDLSLLLARRLSNDLSQTIVKQILSQEGDKINPLEMYQYPPDTGSCNPADIYKQKSDNSLWMVMTPACDFEQNKAENVLLVKITPLTEHVIYKEWVSRKDECSEENDDSKKALKVARGKVKSLIKGAVSERYKFLPGTFFIPDCILDFQDVMHYPRNKSDDFDVICSMDNPYREEMLHLFSKYYGRIGTPDYDFGPIWESIDKQFEKAQG